ncbi:Helix-turn-helix domain-containing protein [Actinomyces denticolens]|uniref:Helix-turn-helix domain-containing protein n=1 Tax=Actinomyces denticolens TaxID=52767 RepID=A0ABY1IB45_9ACTO|nr:helix-turn-helix transcriptional regulator [Actinomyces denticolens]SHI91411.1 Helix-turn-helix domain-containing protein [Actinomyces denticolens]
MERIAERVKEALVASGLTQAELARLVAMSESALSKALGGTRSFAAVEIAEIARVLGASLHYLITGEPDPFEVRAAARHAYDRASRTYATDAGPDREVLESIALLYRQAALA